MLKQVFLFLLLIILVVYICYHNYTILNAFEIEKQTYIRIVHDAILKSFDLNTTHDITTSIVIISNSIVEINALCNLVGGAKQLSYITNVDIEDVMNILFQQKKQIMENICSDSLLHGYLN
jgi:GTP cyclohydrolase III